MINPEDTSAFLKYSPTETLMPQPETLEISKQKSKLIIGIPKEVTFQENRIALVPEAVGLLVQKGHRILIESEAGKIAHFLNIEFSEMGGEIVSTAEEVYQADIILKVAPPTSEEISLLKTHQTIISSVQLSSFKEDAFRQMMAKKITAISFENIKDKTGQHPVIRAMSEIAGNTSIILAAEYLSNLEYGKGIMLGGFSGITPTEVVIIGAGTVGEFAARAAMGMGALVKIFDDSIYKLRRLQASFNNRIFTSILHPQILLQSLKNADVVIGALRVSDGKTSVVVTEEMVKSMKKGSVLIDVSIDQGGCFETSHLTNHSNPIFEKFGVTHYCVPNIASKVPHTASFAFSNFFAPTLLKTGEEGGIENLFRTDYGLRQGVYLYNGVLTNKYMGDYFHIPSQDIDLLMAAMH
ncbi:MAG TPA: alanine dehydrogenase [Bacteroidales bacterium]|nr:alanine dehydrogenase [Bacteroidales bacterium]